MFSTTDTIVAIATPAGRGGIGVVRVSGANAPAIAATLTQRESFPPRHATFCRIVDATARTIDEVVVTWFAAPHSYTGEDVVEISGHGSPVLLEQIVQSAINAGARLAEPGEFTLRAYLAGRLDLVQAEAVADLINAVTPLQARAAIDQLDGTLTTEIHRVDAVLFSLIAKCEASLDFPEEGFHFLDAGEIAANVGNVLTSLNALLKSAARGRLVREGRVVVLSGRPNTGKSTLFNALLGRERAIVTDVAGTTRDLLSERVDLHGVPVTLVDTAGIRTALDPVEREGVSRAENARTAAEMVLVVLDGSVPLTDIDRQLLTDTKQSPRIVVVNKADQPAAWNADAESLDVVVNVSATTGQGLDELRQRIVGDLSASAAAADTPAITNIRHITLIENAAAALTRARAAVDAGATEELLLIDLHEARTQLEAVTGRRTADDVLHHIFAKFCIGK